MIRPLCGTIACCPLEIALLLFDRIMEELPQNNLVRSGNPIETWNALKNAVSLDGSWNSQLSPTTCVSAAQSRRNPLPYSDIGGKSNGNSKLYMWHVRVKAKVRTTSWCSYTCVTTPPLYRRVSINRIYQLPCPMQFCWRNGGSNRLTPLSLELSETKQQPCQLCSTPYSRCPRVLFCAWDRPTIYPLNINFHLPRFTITSSHVRLWGMF